MSHSTLPSPHARQLDVEHLRFMFATGIECSNPISKSGGGVRVDQLELTQHYTKWKTDLALVRELGIRYLRYGLPIHKVFLGPGRYDWSFADKVLVQMRELGITPILDLVHFGLPDWLGDFQNPDWPNHLADYAHAVVERYPWLNFFTPVNEMYITAQFSAAFGWWNEQARSDEAFVRNVKHCAIASILVMKAILERKHGAIFVFSESTEYVHPGSPTLVPLATFLNERRFLALDFLFGHDVSARVYRFLKHSGMTTEEYDWFQNHHELRSHCIMGTDYYITNEHVLNPDGRTTGSGDIYGYYVITRQYYDRYRVPVMHTETNRVAPHASGWLWKEWVNLLRLRQDGVPIIGFTWYGLIDMVDWDSALTNLRGHVNKVGLFSLDRRPRKVSEQYRQIIEQYTSLQISGTKFPILTS